jgi:pyruvate formate lyase activating enzyme
LTETLSFISLLEKNKKPYWIRYVLVPGLNDRKMDLARLKGIMSKFKRCQKFEIIPYHTFGRHKWKYLGMRYFLKDTPPATIKDIKEAQKVLVGLRIGE